jgi:hypothetical protein
MLLALSAGRAHRERAFAEFMQSSTCSDGTDEPFLGAAAGQAFADHPFDKLFQGKL